MGFFTTRDRLEADKAPDARVQPRIVRDSGREFAPRRHAAEPDISGHVGVLMQRVTDGSLREIDTLIARLQQRREQLIEENDRVQRQVVAYAQMSQATMQSTKIISESLAHFVKRPEVSADALETNEDPARVVMPDRNLDDEPLRELAAEAMAAAVAPLPADALDEQPDAPAADAPFPPADEIGPRIA
ncbi:MAG: hypothetical protein IT537_22635 [Hyphomicrobiales bacterium]|nr:hypothetical protein [Hyphomicrobiales bacterium]